MYQFVTLTDFARMLGVHPDTVRRWVKRNPDFPQPVRLPSSNRLRFKTADVDAYIAAQRQE